MSFVSAIKSLVALAFVPVNDAVHAYETLVSTNFFVANEEFFEEMLQYFERTWIGEKKRNHRRTAPLFPIDMWNSYQYVIDDLPRTNNAVEGWHNAFINRVGKHHTSMTGFIRTLQTEQGVNESLFEQLSIGREDVIPKKRRKYKDYNERLKNVVSNYDSNDIKDYLYSV